MRQEKITQLSFDELLDQQQDITAYDPNLTKLENRIKDYIFKHHKGYENGISQKNLSSVFGLGYEEDGGRNVRYIMVNITEKSMIDFDSGYYGYFACIPEKGEIRNGNRINRTLGTIKTIVKSNPNTLNLFYKELNELKAEL